MEESKLPNLAPRKIPKQQRSIALVDALKETCLHILRTEGAKALTVSRLAEESGVAITSIYEYFPNIESVVAAVLRNTREQLIRDNLDALETSAAQTSLYEYLLHAIRNSIHIRQSLARLHREIYERHIDEFDPPTQVLLEGMDDIDEPRPSVRRVIEQFRDEITFPDLDEAAYMTIRFLQVATRTMVLERNLLEIEPDMDHRIAHTLHSMLTAPGPRGKPDNP